MNITINLILNSKKKSYLFRYELLKNNCYTTDISLINLLLKTNFIINIIILIFRLLIF